MANQTQTRDYPKSFASPSSEQELTLQTHLKAIKNEYQKLISTLKSSEHLSYNQLFSVSKLMLSSTFPTCYKCFRPC